MARKKQQEDHVQKLRESFDRWHFIYEHGCGDPTWPDGTNLDLVRTHIQIHKQQIEKTMEPDAYPDIYYRALPPKVSQDYMAKPDEIRAKAKVSLALYKTDEDYHFLARRVDGLNPKDEKRLCVRNILNYVVGLEMAISKDDLVTMRRHGDPETYISSFRSCAEKIRELKPLENEQISLFSIYDDYDEQDMDDEDYEM